MQHPLSEPIRVEDIAKELFMSHPYLFAKCKEETGETLTDFILKEKTEEAKRLLRDSDKTFSAIGSYFGFSPRGIFPLFSKNTPDEPPRSTGRNT